MTQQMTGGCQCGRIRYSVAIDDADAYLCHCRMCQRATGGVSIAFRNVRKVDVAWSREPDYHASSPIARRSFCRECGTPLGFAFLDGENMDLTIGSFDEPGYFVPNEHFAIESRLEHWRETDHLPGSRTEDNPSVAERWMKTVGKLPD